ncbi:MAG TPA: GH3 auxin-responsive promoter, partial [Chloroflexi bacterium]|nr:GH3 auxin-responsive promoter [Chloroflexota bacterium]
MTRPIDLLRQGRKEELWQMCCGFLNLSLEQFMAIQKRLLLEQIELLKNSELGWRVMGGAMPETVEEFREQVPLTTYSDYLPELVEKREDVLPTKPAIWVHTVGRAGEYTIKLVPISEGSLHDIERVATGIGLLASCNSQGDFPIIKRVKSLSVAGSRYYGSGLVGHMMQRAFECQCLPSNVEEMAFQEKLTTGFGEALDKGIDGLGGLSAALVYVGEIFRQGVINLDSYFLLSHPRASARLLKGLIRSKLAGRPILPKDLWSIKVALGGGTDSAVFRKRAE